MWQALASLALNAGKRNKEEAEQNRADTAKYLSDIQERKQQNVLSNRSATQNQINTIDQTAAGMRGNTTQQQVLDDILNKYNVKL